MPLTNIGGIVCKAYLTTNTSVTSGQPIPFDAVVYDTTNSFNTSTHVFAVPVAGKYRVGTQIGQQGSGAGGVQVFKNGAAIIDGPVNEIGFLPGSPGQQLNGWTSVQCVAGDTLSISPDTTSTFSGSDTYMIVEKVA